MGNEKRQIDGDLADSIAMLEQILEVMPRDPTALRALYNAYNQCGQQGQAFEYLSMLAGVVCDNSEYEMADFVLDQLRSFEGQFPSETATQCERIRSIIASESTRSDPVSKDNEAPSSDTEINEELTLAWRLYEEGQLSQEEYSSVLHDLTEVSSKEVDVPVSVLHVLHDRGFNQMNRILNYLSSRSGIPCISLRHFDLTEQVADVFPLHIPARDGALPFGFFGNDLLVAVLNPFNNVLVGHIEKSSGHRCHTYLVSSEEYDMALEKLRGLAA